jgi:hypothetical protein
MGFFAFVLGWLAIFLISWMSLVFLSLFAILRFGIDASFFVLSLMITCLLALALATWLASKLWHLDQPAIKTPEEA